MENIHIGQIVEYHGSMLRAWGLWTVEAMPPVGDDRGYHLVPATDDTPFDVRRLTYVARASITPYTEDRSPNVTPYGSTLVERLCEDCGADVIGNDPHALGCPTGIREMSDGYWNALGRVETGIIERGAVVCQNRMPLGVIPPCPPEFGEAAYWDGTKWTDVTYGKLLACIVCEKRVLVAPGVERVWCEDHAVRTCCECDEPTFQNNIRCQYHLLAKHLG